MPRAVARVPSLPTREAIWWLVRSS